MKGYALKWRNAKILLGCAYFHDLLKPASILCKTLQADEVYVVTAVEAILKTTKNLEKVKATSFEELVTVKKVLSRISHEGSSSSYQGADLIRFTEAVTFFKANHHHFCDLVQGCLRDRLATQKTDLLTHTLTILATQGWEKATAASFAHIAIEAVSSRYQVPLEQAKVDLSLLKEEWDDMLDYSKRYLDLVTQEIHIVWWKVFNCTSAKNWANILGLVELLFSLPMSNGHVEHVFSQLKVIKTNRRACLGENRLDSLLRIATTAPPLSQWDATRAVEL